MESGLFGTWERLASLKVEETPQGEFWLHLDDKLFFAASNDTLKPE